MPRPQTVSLSDVTLRLQAGGPQRAADLAANGGVDRSHIARLLNQAGRQVERIGAARRARYALRRSIRALGDGWPVYRLDEGGRAREFGRLESFWGGWRMSWAEPAPAWSHLVTDVDDWSQGFPFFLSDLRPQGFVGRIIARRVAAGMSLPLDPTSWGDDQVLVYLEAEGDDLPGNFVVGDGALRRALGLQAHASAVVDRSSYAELASMALHGGLPGSSAGGEQPKFLTRVQEGGESRAVLVKFSPLLETPAGRRWADLLVAEAIAWEVLAAHGEGTSGARLTDSGGRRFLEVPRFDRVGEWGRRGVISLTALQGAEGALDTTDWVAAAEHFATEGILSAETAASVRRRRAFGELIGNSDMHPGNLAFFLSDQVPLALAPTYDMLPMLWAPVAGGEILDRTFNPLPPVPRQAADWSIAAGWAEAFWERLVADPRVSSGFVEIAHRSRETVAHLRRGYGS